MRLFTYLLGTVTSFSVSRNVAYKKLLEYLFWIWDPQLPGGQNEPERILEEGFMDSENYKVRRRPGPKTGYHLKCIVYRNSIQPPVDLDSLLYVPFWKLFCRSLGS